MLNAQKRANQTGHGCVMAVYVGAPDCSQAFTSGKFNPWFVRRQDEPAPEGAELFAQVYPERPGVLPIVLRFYSPRFS